MERELSVNERVIWLCDQAGSENFVTVAHVSGSVDEHVLRTALDMISKRHSAIKNRIEIREGVPVFTSENVPSVPLRVDIRLSDDHWQAETEIELNTSFPWFTGPFLRVVLLKGENVSDLLVTFFHVIGDGMSSIYFIQDFLSLVGQITEGNAPDMQLLPERPPVEDLLPESARGLGGLMKIAILLGKQLIDIVIRHPKKLPIDSEVFSKDSHVNIIHRVLSSEETESLITRCQKESTSVHGALCAAMLKAATSQIYSTLHDNNSVVVSLISAVDIRHFLSPPVEREIGFFASTVITSHRIDTDTGFWDLARNTRRAVQQAMKSGEPLVSITLSSKIAPTNTTPEDFVKTSLKFYPAALMITNLGHLDIPERYGPLVLREINFVFANKAAPEHFSASVVTYQNRLTVNFTHTEPTVSQSRATSLAEDTMKALRSALHDDS
jgi:NRPS condensation-like uncharacterized protein